MQTYEHKDLEYVHMAQLVHRMAGVAGAHSPDREHCAGPGRPPRAPPNPELRLRPNLGHLELPEKETSGCERFRLRRGAGQEKGAVQIYFWNSCFIKCCGCKAQELPDKLGHGRYADGSRA